MQNFSLNKYLFLQYNLDESTGQLLRCDMTGSQKDCKTLTVISRIRTLWHHIKASRSEFEAVPDTGLLSKVKYHGFLSVAITSSIFIKNETINILRLFTVQFLVIVCYASIQSFCKLRAERLLWYSFSCDGIASNFPHLQSFQCHPCCYVTRVRFYIQCSTSFTCICLF